MKEMGGRREVVVETFEEAKAREYYFPMPKKPENSFPEETAKKSHRR